MTYPLVSLWLRHDDRDGLSSPPSPPTRARARDVAPVDELALVRRIQLGDSAALGALYEAAFQDLWLFARRYVGDAFAEEIVQDVFLWLWTRRDWNIKTTVRAYLYGAVRHRTLNSKHRHAIEARATELLLRDSTLESSLEEPDSLNTAELRAMIAKTVATFPERQRAAIILRIDRGLSYSEIGDALGISATAAGNLVKKGETKLQEALRPFL